MTPAEAATALTCPIRACGGYVTAEPRKERPWRFRCVACGHVWRPDSIDVTQHRARAVIVAEAGRLSAAEAAPDRPSVAGAMRKMAGEPG